MTTTITNQQEWDQSADGGLMLSVLARTTSPDDWSIERRPLVAASCASARLALQYGRVGEERPRILFALLDRWVGGDESVRTDIKNATNAVFAAVNVIAPAHETAVCSAASAAAEVLMANPAANAALYASMAAATSADNETGYAAARDEMLARCADAIRTVVPVYPA